MFKLCSFSLCLLSFVLGGCFNVGDGPGDAFADGCIGAEIQTSIGSLFAKRRRGMLGHVDLVGFCGSFEDCSADSPIMRGSELDVIAEGNLDTETNERHEPFDLVSSNESVVSATEPARTCGLVRTTLTLEATGTAFLSALARDGSELETFELEVAEAATIELSEPDPSGFVLEGAVILQASVRDAQDRRLAPRGGIAWTVAGDGVLVVDGEMPTGGALVAEIRKPGTTTVRASAGELEAEIEITVP